MKKSPFHDFLAAPDALGFEQFLAGAKQDEHYIDWNGYVLPMEYSDAESEYRAIRDHCAIFDASPLRKYRITGKGAGDFLDHLCTRPSSHLEAMRGIYVAFCQANGALLDDAILHKYADDDYLLLPADMDHSAHFDSVIADYGIDGVSVVDCTDAHIAMAVQGPKSTDVLSAAGLTGVEQLSPLQIGTFSLSGASIRVARMGFTADLGYECWMDSADGQVFTDALEQARGLSGLPVPGYGLRALDACRLEGGFIVPGWDCSTVADPQAGFERTPFELGLGWLVDLDGGDFVGKASLQVLQQTGPRHCLRGVAVDRSEVDINGAPLFDGPTNDAQCIGSVNGAQWSWDLEQTIGNATVGSQHSSASRAWVELGDERINAVLHKGPFRRFERSRQIPAPLSRK